jgi:hypothetical protein
MEVATDPGAGAGEAGSEGAAGNDQADSLDGLYDLGSVPEELRRLRQDVAKQIQGNVTRRFQEHADFRKTWEPFSQVEGLTDLPPEELQELVQFREIASDPAQFDDWLVGIAEAMAEADPDRFQAVFGRLGESTGLFGDDGEDDGDEGGDGGDRPESLREMFTEMLDERLGPIEQHVNHSSQESRVNAAREQIANELEQIAGEHKEQFGEELDDDARTHIKRSRCRSTVPTTPSRRRTGSTSGSPGRRRASCRREARPADRV